MSLRKIGLEVTLLDEDGRRVAAPVLCGWFALGALWEGVPAEDAAWRHAVADAMRACAAQLEAPACPPPRG